MLDLIDKIKLNIDTYIVKAFGVGICIVVVLFIINLKPLGLIVEKRNKVSLDSFSHVNVETYVDDLTKNKGVIESELLLSEIDNELSKMWGVRNISHSCSFRESKGKTFKLNYTVKGYKDIEFNFFGSNYVFISSPYHSDTYLILNGKSLDRVYKLLTKHDVTYVEEEVDF